MAPLQSPDLHVQCFCESTVIIFINCIIVKKRSLPEIQERRANKILAINLNGFPL